ncbi:DinB family protein [Nocardioides caeni]|uniref:DinB family protein n=1 Tax=Nocardioides caeni TaxID=574700 RepID=A0A4S8NRB1_9ACTN|nr:DinB family protein [Nocardioides caeni]THV17974.1 DinB family protein [Nocardioides caeni]
MTATPGPRTKAPHDGDERTSVTAFLDYFRATLLAQCDGVDATGLARPLAPSTMTLGGLLKHLAYVEDFWFGIVLAGRPPAPPWDTVDWKADGDWDWHSAVDDSPEELRALLLATIERSREVMAAVDSLDQRAAGQHPGARDRTFTARWIMLHMIEEYARHCGHADLLRENVDGATGI